MDVSLFIYILLLLFEPRETCMVPRFFLQAFFTLMVHDYSLKDCIRNSFVQPQGIDQHCIA
jgi:hypothetical protein